MYTVYEMTSKKHGEKYIGCTVKPIEVRLGEHRSRHKTQPQADYKLYQFSRKHGFDFEIKKIKSFSDKQEAMSYEKKMIKQRGTLNTQHSIK